MMIKDLLSHARILLDDLPSIEILVEADPAMENKVIYMNQAALRAMELHHAAFAQALPFGAVHPAVGGSIHQFHKDPERVRRILRKLGQGPGAPHETELTIGGTAFLARLSAVIDDGKVIAYHSSWQDITQHKALQDSSAKNEALLKNASDGIHVLDENGFLLEASNQFCAMLGYSRDEMLGMHVSQWDGIKSETEQHEFVTPKFSTQGLKRFETSHRRKDGSVLTVEISRTPIQIQGKWVLFSSSRDITKRKALEHSLQASLAYQRQLTNFNILLSEANQAIARAEDESSLLQELCHLAVLHTNIRLAWVGRPDEHGNFQVLAQAGDTEYLDGVRISTRPGELAAAVVTSQAWRTAAPVYDFNLLADTKESRWAESARRHHLETSTAIPLRRNGALWAIANFYRGKEGLFNPDTRGILEELSRNIGFGLDRLDLVHRERDAQVFNAALLNNLNVGVNVMRYPDRIIEQVNEQMLDMFKAPSKDALVGHSSRVLYPDTETYEKTGQLVGPVIKYGKAALRGVHFQKLDGTPIYIDLSGQRMRARSGDQERLVWTMVDVTERHHNEEMIRQLNATQESLLANTATGIHLVEYPQGIIREVNQGFLDIWGYVDAHEVIGRPIQDTYPCGEEGQAMATLTQQILSEGGGSLRNLVLKQKNGRLVYVDISGRRLLTDQDHQLIVWTSMDVTERHNLTDELSRQSTTDLLTNLPNRRALDLELDRATARADRTEKLLAVCMMDLDGFKPINDTHGHDAGDLVLQVLAKRLQEGLRKTDFVARLGGDEFVLLVNDISNLATLDGLLEKMGTTVRAPIMLASGEEVSIDLSLGVALYPFQEGDNPDALLRLADHALYEAKAHKEDRIRSWAVYGHPSPKKLNNYQQWFRGGGLVVFYQPILDSRSRLIVGMEALARLQASDGRVIVPDEFLSHFNKDDLFDLTHQVFLQALADMGRIDIERPDDLRLWISVNLDPSSLNDAFMAYLRAALASNVTVHKRITFEILEGGEFLNTDAAMLRLEKLRVSGVRIALDDVGSAYSSLLRLKTLPVDEIKLDQSFVRTLEDRPEDLYFVTTMQKLAENFGVHLVVEGVETDDILDALTVLDAGIFQGYTIAKPMPIDEVLEFLKRPPKERRQHPTGLFGLYAALIVHNESLRRAIQQDPLLAGHMPLSDANVCRITKDLRRLGILEGSVIDRLHMDYHKAMAAMDGRIIGSPNDNDWNETRIAERNLLAAVIGEYHRGKSA
ncbi:MAG TPA: EAL domain-containing protein [Acidiferrobacter sp.]|nr:EAL domain-containing protein [Acidiferrobacter sp.]